MNPHNPQSMEYARYEVDRQARAARGEPSQSQELEAQACALVKQYGMVLMMAPPVKAFFKRLAVFLKWEQLEKMV